MDEQTQRVWAERTVRAVSHVFPDAYVVAWTNYGRYLPQALVCADLIEHCEFYFSSALHLLNNTAYYLTQQGRFTQAEHLLKEALALERKYADMQPQAIDEQGTQMLTLPAS
jgi:hypothetical protein